MASVVPVTQGQLRRGAGWTDLLLADATTSGEPLAMSLRRLALEAGAVSEPQMLGESEGLVYVVRGGGHAQAGGESFALAPESVLWLDAGDPPVILAAGSNGLEVLVARAPDS